jgi:CRP-like cAMP-binding protein
VATYVTETPVELLAFPASSLWHLLDRVPELARRMLVSLSERRD